MRRRRSWAGRWLFSALIMGACGSSSLVVHKTTDGGAVAGGDGAAGAGTSSDPDGSSSTGGNGGVGAAGAGVAGIGAVGMCAAGAGAAGGGVADAGAAGVGGPIAHAPKLHRAVATACPAERPLLTCMHDTSSAPSANGCGCKVDGDCRRGANGRCGPGNPNDGMCDTCSYDTCFSDSECHTGGPCVCRPDALANGCIAGNCRVDADCGPGGYCSPSLPTCGYPMNVTATVGYYCHTPSDTCIDDGDCAAPNRTRECRYHAADAKWSCEDFPGCPA